MIFAVFLRNYVVAMEIDWRGARYLASASAPRGWGSLAVQRNDREARGKKYWILDIIFIDSWAVLQKHNYNSLIGPAQPAVV